MRRTQRRRGGLSLPNLEATSLTQRFLMSITSLTPEFDPVRVGLIGVGRHARLILLPALALVPELQLCCVATAHTDTARAASERYRVKAYIGFEDMLDHPGMEAVLVVGGQHG